MGPLVTLLPTLIEKGVDIFSKKYQTESEKHLAQQNFQLEAQAQIQGAYNAEQEQLTARHKADMQSDNWLSKNIRPMVLVYLMGLFTLAFFKDVPLPVMETLSGLLQTAFIFYFGARTLEKLGTVLNFRKGK